MNPFFPHFEDFMDFFVLQKKETTAFPSPPVPVPRFHKLQLIIASPARGSDLVAVTWSLFHTQPPGLLSACHHPPKHFLMEHS